MTANASFYGVPGFSDRRGRSRGADDGFRRHAADVKAIAAHKMFLNERDLRAKASRAHGADQARCAAADDNEVVARGGRGILPVGRVDVGDEFLIVRVPRLDGWLGGSAHFDVT